jgi:hypothetical protein
MKRNSNDSGGHSNDNIVTVSFRDLETFEQNCDRGNVDNHEQARHLQCQLVLAIGQAFGSSGLGILRVKDMPFEYGDCRQKLLPLAYLLSESTATKSLRDVHLVDADSMYHKGYSHGKEQFAGKADFSKASYYANPLTDNIVESIIQRQSECENVSGTSADRTAAYWREQAARYPEFYAPNLWPSPMEEPSCHEEWSPLIELRRNLKPTLCRLAKMLHNTGLMIAGVCDAYCQGLSNALDSPGEIHLKNVLERSLNCNARLLYYFPQSEVACISEEPNLWCGWHNDHVRTFKGQHTIRPRAFRVLGLRLA